MTLQVYQNPVGDCHQLGGVQLPQADIAKATQPGLFDDLPESAFTVDHRLIINARPADRMLLCLALPVSNAAKIVAAAIAYHGWSSWPSRETLCRLTDLKSPNVSRATKELEEAGIIARRRRYHSGGNVGIQYTFNGLALAKATVEQEHPTLQGAIINVITAESDGSAEGTPAQIQKAGRDYHIDNGAIITLIPEPEDRTGRGTLIDDHQSNSGSSDFTNDLLGDSDARAKEICPACDSSDFGPPACTNCGLIADLPAASPEAVPWPPWYRDLAAKVNQSILPEFRWIDEAQMLAGWSAPVMRKASDTYARVYGGKTVNAPVELFKKLAIQAARELSGQQTSAKSKSKSRR